MKKSIAVVALCGLFLASCAQGEAVSSSSVPASPASTETSSVTPSTSSAVVSSSVAPAVSIAISGADTVVAGEDITLIATVTNAADTSVTWTTSDATIATVTAGVVHGVKAGSVTIMATSVADPTKNATKSISVTAPAVAVAVAGAAEVGVDLTTDFTATVTNATDVSVTWTSSAATIASVDATGKVTGVAVGRATIRATSVADPTKYAEKDISVVITADELGTKIKYAKDVTGAFEETVKTTSANEGAHYFYKLTAAAADVYYVALSDSTIDSAVGGSLTTVAENIAIYDGTGKAVNLDSLTSSTTLATEAKAWESEHIVALEMAANDVFYIAVSPAYDSETSFGYGNTKVTVSTASGDTPEEAVDYAFGVNQSFQILHDVQRQFYKVHLTAGTYKWTGVLSTFFYADIYNVADLTIKVASYLRSDASFITVTAEGDYLIAIAGYTATSAANSFMIANPADGEVPAKAIALTLGTAVKVGKGGGFTYYSVALQKDHNYRFTLKNPSSDKAASYYAYPTVADVAAASNELFSDAEEYSYGEYDTSTLTKKYTPTVDGAIILKVGYKGGTSSSLTAFDFLAEELIPGASLDTPIATTGGSIQPGVSGKYYSFAAPSTSFYNVVVSGATGTTKIEIYTSATSSYSRSSGTTAAGMMFGGDSTYIIYVSDTVDEAVTLTISAAPATAFANAGTATIDATGYVARAFTAPTSDIYTFTVSGATGASASVGFYGSTDTSGYSGFSASKDSTTGVYTATKKIAKDTVYWVVIKGTAADALTFGVSGITEVAAAPTIEGTPTTATATIASSYGDAYMKINLVAGKYYSFVASSASGYGKIGLLGMDMSEAMSTDVTVNYKPDVDGIYFLHFYSSSAEDVTVTMNISSTAPQDGKSSTTAWVITEGTPFTKVLSEGNYYYFAVTAQKTGTYTIASSSTAGDPDLSSITTADGTSLDKSAGNTGDFSVTADFTAGTTYIIKVKQYSAEASVTITVTAPIV
jgi:uncharacterized protein YjdB